MNTGLIDAAARRLTLLHGTNMEQKEIAHRRSVVIIYGQFSDYAETLKQFFGWNSSDHAVSGHAFHNMRNILCGGLPPK